MAVAFDAAVADSAVAVGDEPGDGSFDHGPVLPVVGEPFTVTPGLAGASEVVVVFADVEGLAADAGGAA